MQPKGRSTWGVLWAGYFVLVAAWLYFGFTITFPYGALILVAGFFCLPALARLMWMEREDHRRKQAKDAVWRGRYRSMGGD